MSVAVIDLTAGTHNLIKQLKTCSGRSFFIRKINRNVKGDMNVSLGIYQK